MNDITGRADVEALIDTFYDRVRKDDTIGFIFNEIIGDNWSHHLPVMYDFWNMVLFSQPGYAGNPTRKHLEVNRKIPLTQAHFDRWLQLWKGTVDEMFAGENAEQAKNRAALMANLIKIKVDMDKDGKLIQ